VTVTLSVWSQAPGYLEGEAVVDELIRLLHEAGPEDIQPAPTGWEWWSNVYDRCDTARMDDGKTRQFACDFKLGVQRTTP
jgi:hypothetical protein